MLDHEGIYPDVFPSWCVHIFLKYIEGGIESISKSCSLLYEVGY